MEATTTYHLYGGEKLRLAVKLPASKSISNRALIIHTLAGGTHTPANLSTCDDTEVLVRALKDMPPVINIKAAGTAMRFMTTLLSATDSGEHVITGTERMQHRPIKPLVDALRHLGADISYESKEGFPPLRIRGRRLTGGVLEVESSVSSQYISALLLIGPTLEHGLELRLQGEVISRPYIDLTLWMMREFGADAEWNSVDTITVRPKIYKEREHYYIENDWSAASYWYEMVALSKDREAEVTLEGLMDGSKQGDSAVRYIFSLLGVNTKMASRRHGEITTVTLKKSKNRVKRLEYDFAGQPDLAQTVVVCCALLGVHFHFTGLQTLKIKETDRIEALKKEMGKLGYVIRDVDGQELIWEGERCEPQELPTIDTYEDHRMALAFAPAALLRPVAINNPSVVSKSYPHYWEDLRKAGMKIEST